MKKRDKTMKNGANTIAKTIEKQANTIAKTSKAIAKPMKTRHTNKNKLNQ